ncbi:MAG: UbiD family decarboxylase [Gemmataceae bacterium]
MGYKRLQSCLDDLQRAGHLLRIEEEVDPNLVMAEIHRRVYQAGGPALLFPRVKGCVFPMVSNLFGTLERTKYIFRHTLKAVRHLVELKIEPMELMKRPWRYLDVPMAALTTLPKRVTRAPILDRETTLPQLPQLKCWPMDGGAFVTLPQVYTEDVTQLGWQKSNLGMYRVQLSGNEYDPERQVGMHYQIHRGIGVHHSKALAAGEPFRVNIFVGGPPALTLAAVMPLPEGLSELIFAGALGGRRVRLTYGTARDGSRWPLPLFGDADFAITGTIDSEKELPEGPFGDHLGYYSLAHPFPVLNVEKIYHRKDAIWPFTVVGRPPQEDTAFGEIIHEITGPIIPTVVHGVHAVHAVDAAGVHPLLLAIGSERYVPYAERRQPQELLTCAHAILGQGQLSLAKYLLIVAKEDDPDLDIHDIDAFFRHLLERIDWKNDLHFQTCTTIDTLDYSGTGFNQGSKVILAAVGEPRRELPTEIPSDLQLPDGFDEPKVCMPGMLAVEAPRFPEHTSPTQTETSFQKFCGFYTSDHPINDFPLILLVDDSDFVSRHINNWLWVVFTRSNPAVDIHGIGAFTVHKHFGCEGSLVIDARIKPHHAPPVEVPPEIAKQVEEMAAPGRPLHRII